MEREGSTLVEAAGGGTDLGTRTVAQTGLLTLFLAGIALVAAGTLKYPAAWAYCVLFFGLTMSVSGYLLTHDRELLARRIRGGDTGEQSTAQNVFRRVSAWSFCALFLIAGLDRRWHWSRVSTGVVILADALVVLGFVIVWLVFRENTFASSVIEIDPKQRVVSTGPYRLVRHPMYSGALLVLVATPLALGSFWAAVVLPLTLTALVLRLLDEERFLAKNLKGYSDYMTRTARHLVPWVW